MSNKAIRNAMMTAKKYARRKFATDGFVDPTSNPLNKDDPSQWLNLGGSDNLDNMNKIGWANALQGTLSNPDKPEDFNPLETSYWTLGGEIAPLTTAGAAAINMMTSPANASEDEEARRYLYDPNYPQWKLNWAKHDLGLDNPQKRGGRIGYDSGGTPVKIDPVTGLPVPQGGGDGTDGSSASSAPSTSDNSTSPTGFGPIDNAMANPGQTAANIGAGIALGALGPIGMGISAANTVSGLLGGPTIGSTLVGPSQPSTPTNVGTVASYSNAPASPTAPASALSSNPNATNFSPSLLNGVDVSSLDSTSAQNSSPSLGVTGLDQFSSANELGQAMGPSESASFGLSGPTGSLSQSGVNGPSGSFGISGPQSDESPPTSATPSGFDFSSGIIGANTDENQSANDAQAAADAQADADAQAAAESATDASSSDSSSATGGDGSSGCGGGCYRGGRVPHGNKKHNKFPTIIHKKTGGNAVGGYPQPQYYCVLTKRSKQNQIVKAQDIVGCSSKNERKAIFAAKNYYKK